MGKVMIYPFTSTDGGLDMQGEPQQEQVQDDDDVF
jgi:hypothetical protein